MSSTDKTWIKANRSVGEKACVEMTIDGGLIALRNSRDHEVILHYTHAEIVAFFDGVKAGEFDHLLDR